MDAKALPLRPSLAQYRKQAKDLLHATHADDAEAVERMRRCPRVRDHAAGGRPAEYALADAQFVIAREHGFDSWPVFASHVERLEHQDPSVARFEAAADAVISGDEAALAHLLRDDPALIRARSTRSHHATLLHYIAANGVEDFRQRTPANAVVIARVLIDAHAEVDATADTYGGGPTMTTLNLLASSVHPARAGLQVPLAELLLDAGAAIEGVARDGSPLLTALAFRYPDAAEALARRGARVDTVLAAAGLGRQDIVQHFVRADGSLNADVRLASAPWGRLARNPQAHTERALIWAATLGQLGVTKFLSGLRLDLGAKDEQGFTALHWAAFQGHQDVVEVLLHHHGPLEATNSYGGTVLGSTIWASMHVEGVFRTGGFTSVNYIPIVERLLAAGARVDAVGFPSGNAAIDDVLARHGARAS
jgi:ankyrin repeat protein